MKKYFLYELKKCLVPFIIITFAEIIVYVLPISLEHGDFSFGNSMLYLAYLMTALGIACSFMPIWLFNYRMKKRSTDLYYSLPMTKTKQLAVHYLTGFITIIASYTVAFVLGLIATALKFGDHPVYVYYICLYFATIIPAYIIYSIASFAFTRANSALDGFMFIFFATFAGFMVTMFLSIFIHSIYESLYLPYTMLDQVTCFFQDLILGRSYEVASPFINTSISYSVNIIVNFVLYSALSIVCTIGMFMTERNSKAENCHQVSESIFGYRTMIPLYLFCLSSQFNISSLTSTNLMLLALLVLVAYAIAVMYKKSAKIGWKFAVVLLCATVLGIIFGSIANVITLL